MWINFERALKAYDRLEGSYQLPTLSPIYVEIDAQRQDDLEPFFWLYEEGENFVYQGGHLARIPATHYRDIQTPYQYGGPVSNKDDAAFLLRAWQEYTGWCRENAAVLEFVRFHPLLRNWNIYPGEATFNRIAVRVDLASTDLMTSYQTRVRTAVRKAEKNGLRVEWREGSESAEWFMEFYHSAMREIAADQFYFFPRSYFRKLLEWKQTQLAVCMNGAEPIAAAVFLVGPVVSEYHLSATNRAGKQLGATNLLVHAAAQAMKSRGCRTLYLGGGTDDLPDNPLLFFKSGFSRERAEFKIAKYVHSREGYLLLTKQFSNDYEARPNRVLFYR
jgi:hypothetical protein